MNLNQVFRVFCLDIGHSTLRVGFGYSTLGIGTLNPNKRPQYPWN